jgi:hypothetical protein
MSGLSNGKVVSFECVDVFELSESRDKFAKLAIIYDTARLRVDFQALGGLTFFAGASVSSRRQRRRSPY